ncbi:reverse transcriptase family protein [Luteolibacter arcticus]|uniref:RNA-directed DNA polymerase n=1 Tax=Luteolibacter arcticus TaxID=1581411 RepID=A0ABT3GF42_9BACT|nr:reverse transcriptase family protein [Luteolibacter arcticus]MCW1922232.1 reverse transcriptase family protein [Luteolibacter arcticus]
MSERQEIYDRIRAAGGRDKVILEEMIRKGFWKPGTAETAIPEALLKREAELVSDLRSLTAQQRRYQDREAALKEMRRERLAESRRKQKETEERREQERQARTAAWERRKQDEILHLGDEGSANLNQLESHHDRLARHGLPDFATHRILAQAMLTNVGELRFLAYGRKVAKFSHYRRFLMPKKTGGHRLISAPMPRLKQAQHWILEQILNKVQVHEAAHGFLRERSILTNASPHVGASLVINLDLRDFFPNITWPRVFGLFHALGYSRSVATIFAQLCTEPPVEEVELDGQTWQVATGVRHLPQGAPTSPAITNLLCRRFDARMAGIARKHGFAYTRYADDLTFSSKSGDRDAGRKVLWQVRRVIEEEGFHLHPDKLRTLGKGRRHDVTGLTVNESLSVPRNDVRNFKALLHRMEKSGPVGCTWRGCGDRILARVGGFANYLMMVDAARHADLHKRAMALLKRHGFQPEIRHPAKRQGPPPFPTPSAPPALPSSEASTGLLGKIRRWFGGK